MSRKNSREEEAQEGDPAWLCTFNDLMTNLLVFFVLLFTLSSVDTKKMNHFKNGLQGGLGILNAGKMVTVGVIESEMLEVPYINNATTGSEGTEKNFTQGGDGEYSVGTGATQEVADTPAHNQSLDSEKPKPSSPVPKNTPQTIHDVIVSLDSEPGIGALRIPEGMKVTLEDHILFDSGVAQIQSRGLSALGRVAAAISKASYPVRVEGHTDNVPISTPRFPSNWELSIARAVNVVRYFAEMAGLPPEKLSAVGYGESKPLFPNDTPEHRAANRRVEIILVMEGKG